MPAAIPVVYANAAFTTLDPRRPRVAALAVRGERVIAAGDLEECRAAAGPSAREVDLGGAYAVPGLTDCHIHLEHHARGRVRLDLRGAADLGEAQHRLAGHAAGLPAGVWVLGGRYDPHPWHLGRPLHRRDLDAACPDRPVALDSHDGHTVWANTAALRAAGIDEHTPSPPGGRIERDADGPTGVLRETAREAVRALAAGPDSATPLDGLLAEACTDLLAHGITSIHDIAEPAAVEAFRSLRAEHRLTVRVHQVLPKSLLDHAVDHGWHTGAGDPWLRTGPVKLFSDGALGSHTAHLHHAYPGEEDGHGIAVLQPDQLRELIGAAAGAGIASAVHAIGDAANTAVLDAVEAVRATGVGPGLRHRIEHAQLIAPADLGRFAALGVVASMQPIHCTSDIPLTRDLLAGMDLLGYPWQDLAAAGAHVAFGSDAPVETFDPVAGLRAAVTRRDPATGESDSSSPGNTLTARHALRGYTVEAAHASGEEEFKGRLTSGFLADFAVFDADLTDDETVASGEAHALATVVGGELRWERAA